MSPAFHAEVSRKRNRPAARTARAGSACLLAAAALSSALQSPCAFAFGPADTNRILVVYNTSWTGDGDADGVQDSRQIKDYYIAARSIPTNHVLGLSLTTSSYFANHASFYDQLVAPLTDKLAQIGSTNIDVILLIHGVPYRTPSSGGGNLSVDSCLALVHEVRTNNTMAGWGYNPYMEMSPMFGTDHGHFSHASYQYDGKDIYMVCRLTVPNPPWGALNQIDQALYGEKYIATNSLPGTVYVDSRYAVYTDAGLSTDTAVTTGNYNTYSYADKNIAYAEHYTIGTGFPLGWENTGNDAEIGQAGAGILVASNAFLYGGWYNFGRYIDAFEWLPGSIGCDLNSDSAAGMLNGNGWVAGALKRGLTCGSGVIGEPYLTGHTRPNVLLYYILQGYTYAEASHLATPCLQWMCVNLGDPLYTPLRDKTAVVDTTLPVIAAGFPNVTGVAKTQATINYGVQSAFTDPEVVRCTIAYGLTTDYTFTNSPRGYFRVNGVTLTDLQPRRTYHYRLTLTDPFGNAAQSEDATFTTLNDNPVARIVVDAVTGAVPFTAHCDGSSSDDPDGGTITNWAWTFDDGSTGAGPAVSHTYTNPGLYNVRLTVTDDGGLTASTNLELTVNPSIGEMRILQYGRNGYSNMMDNYISTYGAETNRNYGDATSLNMFSTRRRWLFWFDLSSVPRAAVIDSAVLQVNVSSRNYGGASSQVALHRVTRDWTETGSDWSRATSNDVWTTPGGDYDTNIVSQFPYSSIQAGQWMSLDITSLARDWMTGVSSNYGVLGRPTLNDLECVAKSKETTSLSLRPRLVVTYHEPVWVIASSAGTHGAVSPSGAVSVANGGSVDFEVRADPHCHIASIMTNGWHVPGSPFGDNALSNTSFAWGGIGTHGTLTATFAENTWTPSVIPETWLAWYYPEAGDYAQVAESDTDGDGLMAWQEFLAGTDPTNAASVLAIGELSRADTGQLVLRWQGATNRWYRVMVATNIFTEFQPLPDVLGGRSDGIDATVTVSSAETMFYRVGVFTNGPQVPGTVTEAR